VTVLLVCAILGAAHPATARVRAGGGTTSPAAADSRTLRVRLCDRFAGIRGRDGAPGTLRNPFRTIPRLLSALRPGAVGCLLGGTYEGTVVIETAGSRGRPITLRAAPGTRVRIHGAVVVAGSASWVTITQLSIDGSRSPKPFAILVQGDNVVLSHLDVTNPKRHPNSVDGICVTAGHGFEERPVDVARNLTIARSRIHHCGDDAHEHAIYLESTRAAHVLDNMLLANPGYGISMYPDAQGSTIEYNVIDGNASADRANLTFSGEAPGAEYRDPHGSDRNLVRFNLITNAVRRYNVDSYYPAGSASPANNRVVSNCVWNAPYGNFGGRNGYVRVNNREVDPLYVDSAAGNYALRAGSPCAGWGPRR
jgi:hypothetical protein